MIIIVFFVLAAVKVDNIIWISVMVAGFLLLSLLALFIIRKLWGPGKDRFQQDSSAFTLEDLYRMYHDNQISREEYEKIKEKIITQTRCFQ